MTIEKAQAAVAGYPFNTEGSLAVANDTTDALITSALQAIIPADKFTVVFARDTDGLTKQEGTSKGSIKGKVTITSTDVPDGEDESGADTVVFSMTIEITVPAVTP